MKNTPLSSDELIEHLIDTLSQIDSFSINELTSLSFEDGHTYLEYFNGHLSTLEFSVDTLFGSFDALKEIVSSPEQERKIRLIGRKVINVVKRIYPILLENEKTIAKYDSPDREHMSGINFLFYCINNSYKYLIDSLDQMPEPLKGEHEPKINAQFKQMLETSRVDMRRKKDRSTPEIAYAIDILFSAQINNLSKENKKTLFECISGKSGEDIYQNINSHKKLLPQQKTKIDKELQEIVSIIKSKD